MSRTKGVVFRFVSDTTSDRPQYQVRRGEVLHLVPEGVARNSNGDFTASGLAEFFGISRSTAWRLFLAPDPNAKNIPRLGGDSIAAISAAFPTAKFGELFEPVDSEQVST